jgi:cystathionine beta-synthase
MSKPWFLKMAMEAESSPLSGAIAQILGKANESGDDPLKG